MIFAIRGVIVSLALFALLYGFLSVVLVLAWRCFGFSKLRKYFTADALFTLRVIPFVVSAAVSLFLTLPSFLLFEAHSMDEDLGTFVLGACALLFLGAGIYQVSATEVRTRRVVSACLGEGRPLESTAGTITLVSPQTVAPLMLVGLRAPRILISESARQLLSQTELEAAVRHETQHVRSHDNLRKAILSCLPFPGMASLERAWQEAGEAAADDGAVSSRNEALDLAAALIKLTRHFPRHATPAFATGLVSVAGSVTTRVERLLAWRESVETRADRRPYAAFVAVAALLGLVAKLGPALMLIHFLTERLVP